MTFINLCGYDINVKQGTAGYRQFINTGMVAFVESQFVSSGDVDSMKLFRKESRTMVLLGDQTIPFPEPKPDVFLIVPEQVFVSWPRMDLLTPVDFHFVMDRFIWDGFLLHV